MPRATHRRPSVLEEQQRLRSEITAIIGPDAIRAYRSIDRSYTIRDTLVVFALLGSALAATCVLHATIGAYTLLAMPLLAVVTGMAFNWIGVQIHEASHGFLLPDLRSNDRYCDLVLASWAVQDVEQYRVTHGMHHAFLHTERDPDVDVYDTGVGTVRQTVGGIVRDLTLQSAWQRHRLVARLAAANDAQYPRAPRSALVAKVVTQLIVLGVLVAACGWIGFVYYGGVYLYGLLGVYPMLVRIRTVVQHHADLHRGAEQSFVSRTTESSIAQIVLVGARMDYHFEHHLFPRLPYYRLREMHRALEQAGFFDVDRAGPAAGLCTDTYCQAYASLATAGPG